MNRRKMLGLAGGFVLGNIAAKSANAQNSTEPWYIDEDELKTDIILPKNKKALKSIKTDRLDYADARSRRLIKKAEAVYPVFLWANTATENGKALWYVDNEGKKNPFNVTPRAVNYYFNLVTGKNDLCTYSVGINDFLATTKAETKQADNKTVISVDTEGITEVSLFLHYGYYCGKLCCSFFDRTKKVIFNKNEEIIALYMPFLSEGMC